MGYEEAVKEAAGALAQGEEADWRVAQLTYENTRRGQDAGRPARTEGRVSMEKWCTDVQGASSVRLRFGPATGSRYARIWQRYGLDNPSPATSFKDAYAEVDGTPDRERMMAYEAKRLLEQGTTEQKVEATAALLADPVVREEVVAPVGALSAAATSLLDERKERLDAEAAARKARSEQMAQREREKNPVFVELESKRALNDLLGAANAFARAVAAALPKVKALDAEGDPLHQGMWLRDATIRARGAVEQLEALIATGKPGGDVDAFVAHVLKPSQPS